MLLGCEKMNDRHDKYLKEGEIIYIGRVDSALAFPGDERILFHYWISDPRAKTVTVTWSNGKESYTLPIPPHESTDPLTIQIGKNERVIPEGNYTFLWVSKDEKDNTSIVLEKNARVYGARYRETLSDHIILDAQAVDNNVEIKWAASTSEEEAGVAVTYVNRAGTAITVDYPVTGLSTTVLDNVDFSVRPTYQTKYLPTPNAIDTFSMPPKEIPFAAVVNVALGKPVTATPSNDPAAAAQRAENAVNGNIAGDRWVSTTQPGDIHWLEIDLQGEYSINSFKMWNGANTNYDSYPIYDFDLQAWVDGEWKTIVSARDNQNGIYTANFPAVTTTKVRLYITRGGARLYEIEVYSIIYY